MSNAIAPSRHDIWLRRLTGPAAAAAVLAAFWAFMLSTLREKSLTSDEIVHAAAGYSYWKFNDYRLNPENGILPQRVAGLPLALSGYPPFPTDGDMWRDSDEWAVGDHWFHRMGNDLPGMLWRGRAAIGVLTAILGALVWFWSRRLFGPLGGMLSLLLFVANPTVLANGALITSDATCSLFFLAATLGVWMLLHRMTIPRLAASALVVGGLFVSKMSAVLIIPIGLTLMAVRVVAGPPLWLGFGFARKLVARRHRAVACGAILLAHAVAVPVVIWACYGFRFKAFAPATSAEARFQHPWEFVLEKPDPLSLLRDLDLTVEQQARANEVLARYDWHHEALVAAEAVRQAVLTRAQGEKLAQALATPPPAFGARVFEFLRRHELLPEAYIYGYAHAWRFARKRSAFFNGDYGISGWPTFFPYTFLVKTPLPLLGIIGLALAAAVMKRRAEAREGDAPPWRRWARGAYATLPLWLLLAFYWAAVIPSKLNIGHRHIMATYPPLFVLCGAAAWWLEGWRRSRIEAFGGITSGGDDASCLGAPDPIVAAAATGRKAPVAGGEIGFAEPRAVFAARSGDGDERARPGEVAVGLRWPVSLRGAKWAGIAVGVLVVGALGETVYRYPHYLAYFNGIVTPAKAYRHLVDSSLDWGQDLPGVKRYLDERQPAGPVYFSYFGTASPAYYGIKTHMLYSPAGLDAPRTPVRELRTTTAHYETDMAGARQAWPDCEPVAKVTGPGEALTVYFLRRPVLPRWTGGTYIISATMLPAIWYDLDGPLGWWNQRFDARYRELSRAIRPLLSEDAQQRAEAFASLPAEQWTEIFEAFAQFRFARLTAYLRPREPDEQIGFSILVYELTDADLARALDGPPPELGPDFPEVLARRGEG